MASDRERLKKLERDFASLNFSVRRLATAMTKTVAMVTGLTEAITNAKRQETETILAAKETDDRAESFKETLIGVPPERHGGRGVENHP